MDDQPRPEDEQPTTGSPVPPETPDTPEAPGSVVPPDAEASAAPSQPAQPPVPDRPLTQWEAIEAADRERASRLTLPGRRIGVLSVLGRSLDLLIAHPLPFIALHIPTLFVGLLGNSVYAMQPGQVQPPDFPTVIALVLISAVIAQFIGLATIFLADDLRAGRPEALGSAIGRALGRTPASIGMILLLYVILIGLLIVMAIPIVILVIARIGILVLISAVAFSVLFAVVALRWSLAVAAIGLEGAGPVEALSRSLALTRGNAWRLVGAFFVLFLLIGPVTFGLSILALASDQRIVQLVVPSLLGLFTGPLASILLATIFGDLTDRPIAPAPDGHDPLPRRRIVVGATVLAGVLALAVAIPSVGPFLARYSFQGVAATDRGVIHFGTSRSPLNPCQVQSLKSVFSSSDTIYIGGFFTTPLLPGQTGTVEIFSGDRLLNSGPLSSLQPVACYYEINAVQGIQPGSYRVVVRVDNTVLAEGSFVVQ